VKVLATSRETLHLQEEWSYELSGLAYPASERVDDAQGYPAVQFFAQRARQAYVGFSLAAELLAVVGDADLPLDQIAGASPQRCLGEVAGHLNNLLVSDMEGGRFLTLCLSVIDPVNRTVRWARAGHDPAALLGKFRGRVFAVHAKDNAPPGQGKEEDGFAALGKGVLNWNAILPAAASAGVQWYIIEHDHPLDPAAVVQTGAAYLNQHLPAGAGR